MPKMKLVKVVCVQCSALLLDQMDDATLESLRTGVRTAQVKDRPATEVAAPKIYRDGPNGKIGIPVEMLFSCLVNAGRNVKSGKKQISTAKSTMLPDFMSIQDTFLPFTNVDLSNGKKESDYWRVDKRRGRLADGTAICVVRPRFEEWSFEVTIEYDTSKIADSVLRQLFDSAGSTQGLGSFRPNCKGPFGRFKVAEWKEVPQQELSEAA